MSAKLKYVLLSCHTWMVLVACTTGAYSMLYGDSRIPPRGSRRDPLWWMSKGDGSKDTRPKTRPPPSVTQKPWNQNTPQPAVTQKPWNQNTPQPNTGHLMDTPICVMLAMRGSCEFYSVCLQDAVSNCNVKPVVEQYCRNSLINQAEFDRQGFTYIDRVRKCFTKSLWNVRSSKSCESVDKQSLQTLLPNDSSDKACLDQPQFCDVIANEQNCRALFHIFGLSRTSVLNLSARLFDYFLELSQQCSEDVQLTFFENFFKKLSTTPATTTPGTTTQMMMGNGD